jgi:hypothetical protein
MFKKVFRYLFSSYLDEFRDELRFEFARNLVESQTEFDKDIAAIKTEAAVQVEKIRRDMALEMNRAGIALMATNHQIMLLKGDMTVVKTTHNQILEVARKLTYEPPLPEKRTPGQVDWIPSPSHFGNKIEMMP